MKIKEPGLKELVVYALYEVDVEGVKVDVRYTNDESDYGNLGWQYDLTPCYEGLDEDEIADLEEEFAIAIEDLEVLK